MNRIVKAVAVALLFAALPVMALAAGPVLLVDLPESAQMIENVEFDNGDFIQSYQMENGVNVQLLRYTGFTMTLEDLIASDWPVNVRYELYDTTEISGYPAQRAHIWQMLDESGYPAKAAGDAMPEGWQMMEIDLVVLMVDNATLIYQDSYVSGERGDSVLPLIDSLTIQGAESAEVG